MTSTKNGGTDGVIVVLELGVGETVAVGDSVGSSLRVDGGVCEGVAVTVALEVCVGEGVGEGAAVSVGEKVSLGVRVCVGEAVRVGEQKLRIDGVVGGRHRHCIQVAAPGARVARSSTRSTSRARQS